MEHLNFLEKLPTDWAKKHVEEIVATGDYVSLPEHAYDGEDGPPIHPDDLWDRAPGSLAKISLKITCSVFKRGATYDTNFFADVDEIHLLAADGYPKLLSQKRARDDDADKGEGTSSGNKSARTEGA